MVSFTVLLPVWIVVRRDLVNDDDSANLADI